MSHRCPTPLAAGLAVALLSGLPAHAGDGTWIWPVRQHGVPPPTARFDAPDTAYSAGHRGIDLPAPVGAPVRAVANGVVAFAGTVAGVDVVTIDHGTERSTYQPVAAQVEVGQRVGPSDVIGHVALGAFHCATPCIHVGRIRQRDDAYLDPLDRLSGQSQIRLVDPEGPPPVPPVGPTGSGLLLRPIGGPITSTFGMRTHPATGEDSHHDGVDFGAPCGATIRAAGSGEVISTKRSGAYGLRVVVRHATGLESSYSHLGSASVEPGDTVTASDVVGKVGSSGLSTGCHLHFGVRQEGRDVDPLTVL